LLADGSDAWKSRAIRSLSFVNSAWVRRWEHAVSLALRRARGRV